MDILIIGGTRLLGKSFVARLLLDPDNFISVLSRRAYACPVGVDKIVEDRIEGLKKLRGRSYDVVVDFIAYSRDDPLQVFEQINFRLYILISTIWVVRYSPNTAAADVVKSVKYLQSKSISEIIHRYLIGKLKAEKAVLSIKKRGSTFMILRLPIFWGEGDHTHRLAFYCQRVSDGGPLIRVEGGNNIAQIAWTEDIANAIVKFLKADIDKYRKIWEAIPDNGLKVREIINIIAGSKDARPFFVDISYKRLLTDFPEYLDAEPLWHELYLVPTKNNIFRATGMVSTSTHIWLTKLAKTQEINENKFRSLRLKELAYLEKYTHVK